MTSDDVIGKIQQEKARMHSRWYFVVQAALAIVAIVLVFCLLLFIVSFIIFALQQNGGFYATGFGLRGFGIFFTALPWSLLFLSIALTLVLAILLKRYSFIYHYPFLYSLLSLIVVIALAGFLLAATSLHPGVMNYSLRNNVPFIPTLYNFELAFPPNIYHGRIIQFIPNGFVFGGMGGVTSTVILAPDSGVQLHDLDVGELVMVYGRQEATDTIEANGLRVVGM